MSGDVGAYHWQFICPWDYLGRWPWDYNSHEHEKRMFPDWSIEWSWHCPVFEIFRHRARVSV